MLAYSVTFEDNGTYDSTREKNLTLNGIAYKVLKILESNGDSISTGFHIVLDKSGNYAFDVDEGFTLNRFRADIYGEPLIDNLTKKQKNATADQMIEFMSGKEGFSLEAFPDMSKIGASNDEAKAFEVGETIGKYLADLGFDVDFAPVADVLTNQDNTVVARRSFGSDAEIVSRMVSEEVKGLKKHGVSPVLKHFPGHGGTAEDSHETKPVLHRTLEELSETEFLPFAAGIESGADFVMAGHIGVPEIEEDGRPAVFSKTLLTDVLRKQLGFEGIIITDAMNMGAVTESYDSGEAAVAALSAGADMILMPEDFDAAVQAVKDAVEKGALTESRIEESAMRILALKAEKNMERETAR